MENEIIELLAKNTIEILETVCSKCGKIYTQYYGDEYSAAIYLYKEGWTVKDNEVLCDKCNKCDK